MANATWRTAIVTGAAIYLTEVAGKYGDAWSSFLIIGAKTRLVAVGS
jgi:hypothetical protein